MTPEEIETALLAATPKSLWPRLVKATFHAYKRAHDVCEAEYQKPEQKLMLGFSRRAKLEEYLRDVARMEPGVEAAHVRGAGHPWDHTELRSGNVVLTAKAVDKPGAMVDMADYRTTLAEENPLQLFEEPGKRSAGGSTLYAILLHSPSHWVAREDRLAYGHLPGSLHVAFPSSSAKHYLHTVDLFERFSPVVEQMLPNAWDREARVDFLRKSRRVVAA